MNIMKALLLIVILACLAGDNILVKCTCEENPEIVTIETFLTKHFYDWESFAGFSYSYAPPQDHETVFQYLRRLYEEYGEKAADLAELYIKCRRNKEYGEFSQKFGAKTVLRTFVRKTVPKMINKWGPKILATKLGKSTKLFFSTVRKSMTNPVGIGADLVQLGLELFGYECAGSWVGFVGNIAGGAVFGFFVGGPLGAVTGGTVGYGTWKFGEVATPQAIGWLETLVEYT